MPREEEISFADMGSSPSRKVRIAFDCPLHRLIAFDSLQTRNSTGTASTSEAAKPVATPFKCVKCPEARPFRRTLSMPRSARLVGSPPIFA